MLIHSVEYWDEEGTRKKEESWELKLGGLLHREDGPAYIVYNDVGDIWYEWYYRHGKPHREDGPALVKYNEDGSVWIEHYYVNGKRHREDGPTHIEYYEDGSIRCEQYYLNGEGYTTQGEWFDHLSKQQKIDYLLTGIGKC